MKTSMPVLSRLVHLAPSMSCLLATLLLVSAAPAHARSCGGDGQGPCDGGGEWYVKGTCPFCVPWYHSNPDYCTGSNTLGGDGRCHAPKVAPPPPCRADCQARKINAALGNPLEPSNNNSARVSRGAAGISESEFIHIDVGGEGAYGFQTRCDGYESSVNLNPDSLIGSGDKAGQPIPNRVPGYAQNLPFTNAFADKLSVDVQTFDASWAEEMARVIKPHGALTACGAPGVDHFEAGIHQLQQHGLHITETNNAGDGRKELVLAVPPDYVYTPVAVPHDDTCGVELGSGTRGPRQGSPCVIDLMVVYTKSAFQEVRRETIQELARERVEMINTVSANTGLNLQVRLIYVGPTDYDETAHGGDVTQIIQDLRNINLQLTPTNAAAVRRISGLRDALGADLVSVLASNLVLESNGRRSQTCGLGSGELIPSGGFSIVSPYCWNPLYTPTSMAHEVGHNLGLQHSRFTLVRGPDYDPTGYNYAYVDLRNRFYTVMAYADQCLASNVTCSVTPFWSSSTARTGDGHPVGSAREDNARALVKNAPIVAGYKPSRPSAPLLFPATLRFKNTLVGTDSPAQEIGVYNLSPNPITVADVTLTGSNAFTQKADAPPNGVSRCAQGTVIPAQQSCVLKVGFRPTQELSDEATLRVSFNGGSPQDLTAKLTGSGFALEPKLRASVSSDFGNVEEGATLSMLLTLTNDGTQPLRVDSVTTSGAEFSVTHQGVDPLYICQGFPGAFSVDPGQSCKLTVSFHPGSSGQKNGTLTISSNDPATPTTTQPLTGYGTHSDL